MLQRSREDGEEEEEEEEEEAGGKGAAGGNSLAGHPLGELYAHAMREGNFL